ncbi:MULTISPECIES: hypothetical protein [Streptomyces]|uniref:Uncharacterized protein n=1 Tax=Streptomyces galilaeus TaxID=33899 RepID=A0ABW9IXI3_STRGJ
MSDELASPVTSTAADQAPIGTPAVTTVSAHFKLVFIGVMVITVFTLAASLYIGIFLENPTDAAKSAMDTCSTLANLGFGAMVGLLGGKAVN